ncbi:hypothetical protein SAMN05421684_4308 [Asanoa ishikariensis]|uniref:DUF1059 domain-containing protein n=1 Tax=Asanoa ishikariensis TaxID=137265 RepID=A0A1H3RWT1_9ACTN|nr:hypothetical protein SAMN05421684_4308 [Asanoa ishikariensis]
MTLYSCEKCGRLVSPRGITVEGLERAMREHLKTCKGAKK